MSKVLFIDDEPSILQALRRLLAEEPYEVHTTTDAEEALRIVRDEKPTVVIADYYMPQTKGADLLHRVRDIDGGIVRIIFTGRPDLQVVLRSISVGEIYRLIVKPWDNDDLKMVLRNAIDYGELMRERDRLMVEIDKDRQTLEAIERRHPGLTKLPPQDDTGAFLLSGKDLPASRSRK